VFGAASDCGSAALFSGVPVTVTDSPAAALAVLAARHAPLALVCGSLYLLGEVRPLLLGEAAGGRERWQ
ncbi:bifunctional folylpolyglutamate synthase/dihydrofolate synthase, partial [Deinococcus sp. 12RED42]|nr:bifunctional folylpolyglutamate synthase/dihydrofolate synthase [Deinococcus sp. 12RED42]